MTTVTYSVPSIHCGHCTHTIETELGELQGIQSVKADLETVKCRSLLTCLPARHRLKPCLPRSTIPQKV